VWDSPKTLFCNLLPVFATCFAAFFDDTKVRKKIHTKEKKVAKRQKMRIFAQIFRQHNNNV